MKLSAKNKKILKTSLKISLIVIIILMFFYIEFLIYDLFKILVYFRILSFSVNNHNILI